MASIDHRPERRSPYRVAWREASGRQRSRSFREHAAAREFRAEIELELARGSYVQRNKSLSFAEFLEGWFEDQLQWRASTEEAYRYGLASTLSAFGELPLQDVRREDVQAWVKSMVELGLKTSTINHRLTLLGTAMSAAVRRRLIIENPTADVTRPVDHDQGHHWIPNRAQVDSMVELLPEPGDVMMRLASLTALRLGELRGLTADRVSLSKRELTVDRQLLADDTFGPPKSRASRRTIPLAQTAVDLLAVHLQKNPPLQSTEVAAWSGLIFHRRNRPIHRTTIHDWIRHARQELDLPNFVSHSLRHFCVSVLLAAGQDPVGVARFAGHADASVTLRIYGHPVEGSADRIRAVLDSTSAKTTDDEGSVRP